MMREPKTRDELSKMMNDELSDPTISVSVYKSDTNPAGWSISTYIRGPDIGQLIRAHQIAQRLQTLYSLKKEA
jgi:hypothetical protein